MFESVQVEFGPRELNGAGPYRDTGMRYDEIIRDMTEIGVDSSGYTCQENSLRIYCTSQMCVHVLRCVDPFLTAWVNGSGRPCDVFFIGSRDEWLVTRVAREVSRKEQNGGDLRYDDLQKLREACLLAQRGLVEVCAWCEAGLTVGPTNVSIMFH